VTAAELAARLHYAVENLDPLDDGSYEIKVSPATIKTLIDALEDAARWRFAVEMAQPENWAEVALVWPSNDDGGFVGQQDCYVGFGRAANVQAWSHSFNEAIDKARDEERARNEVEP